jgi:hypothetical protein
MKSCTYFYLEAVLKEKRDNEYEKFINALKFLGKSEINEYGEIKLHLFNIQTKEK